MPELPEVETIRQGLAPAMIGQPIARVKVNRRDLRQPIPDDFEKTLKHAQVQAIQRRGKYMIVELNNNHAILWHLGMSGRVRIIPPKQNDSAQKHDHVEMTLQNGTRIIYNDARRFGFMTLIPAQNWEKQPPFSTMGPEPLSNDFNAPVLSARLNGRKMEIKRALLDQKVVVGVGNIYACEALYRASISPFAPADTIKGERAEKLVKAIREVLQEAIAAGGSSLKDYRNASGEMGYFQHHFVVYDREGEHCNTPECVKLAKGCIRRVAQGGRSTFYCENTQKK